MSALDEATRKHLERLAVEAARFAGLTGEQASGLLALFEVVYTGGRAAERADVVAWLKDVKDGTRACRDWVRHDVERGCHVGAATKHADSGSSSDEPGR